MKKMFHTVQDEDMEILDVMQQFEKGEDENEIQHLDESLGNSPQKAFKGASMGTEPLTVCSLEDKCLNDFSMVSLEVTMDELLLKLTQSSQPRGKIPTVEQCDGADDILRTPKKGRQQKLQVTPKTPSTPKRSLKMSNESPKTPKSVSIQLRSFKKNLSKAGKFQGALQQESDDDEIISLSSDESEIHIQRRKLPCLRRKFTLAELRRKSSSVESEDMPLSNYKRRKRVRFDITHTPRRKHARQLTVYTTSESESENLGPEEIEDSRRLKDDLNRRIEFLDSVQASSKGLEPSNAKSSSKSKEFNGINKQTIEGAMSSEERHKFIESNAETSFSSKDCNGARISPKVVLRKCPKIKNACSIRKTSSKGHEIIKKNYEEPSFKSKEFSGAETINKQTTGEVMNKIEWHKLLVKGNSKIPGTKESSSSNEAKSSPRVVLKKCPEIKEGVPIRQINSQDYENTTKNYAKNNEFDANGMAIQQDHKIVFKPHEKTSKEPISNETRISPKVVLRKSSLVKVGDSIKQPDLEDNKITNNKTNKFSGDTLKEQGLTPTSPTTTSFATKDSCSDKAKMSPSVVLKKSSQIKDMYLMESNNFSICTSPSVKENMAFNRKCRLFLKSLKELKERMEKQKIMNMHDKVLLSGDNGEETHVSSNERISFTTSDEDETLSDIRSTIKQIQEIVKPRKQTKKLRIRLKSVH